jgi:valyl-tRNA synthetase
MTQSKKSGKIQGLNLDTLPKQLDFAEMEARHQAKWDREGTYHYRDNAPGVPNFAIDTPPPTVSGSLHIGHVFSYTQTDVLARYQRMNGKNVFYPMGWDDNGLPTERRVQNYFHVRCDTATPYEPGLELPYIFSTMTEKELQEKRLPQRNLSRKNFIEHCNRLTIEDEKNFKNLFSRLGLSVDWSLEYSTINDRSRKLAQYSFLDLHKKGEMAQVEAPTLWDTDFQTAVAQAELEDRTIPGAFHQIAFTVEGSSDKFVIATTRPELLAACVGVTAHPDDERFQHLFGKTAITPLFKAPVPIFSSELVQKDKGTGILMVCTFGDQTDVQWWREKGLKMKQTIGRDGRMQSIVFGEGEFESRDPEAANAVYAEIKGKTIKQAQKRIVELLTLEKPPEAIQHAVKYYEKGDRPVEILTTRQWFVKLVDKKEKLIEQGSKVKWVPEFMESRFKNWTENLSVDWCVSRQRYFGVPIPVWYPIDANGRVVYEKPILPEAAQLPVDPQAEAPKGYTENQRGQAGGFIGDPDVFDTWFTSSITPQVATGWIENEERFKKLFPMDMRPQSHEIIRTWAFYTIAKAFMHEGSIPWKAITVSGWVVDPDRKKMSKSKGNVVTPMTFIEEHGSDSVRYWAALARYGVDTAFDPLVYKVGRRLVTKIFNAGKFALLNSADRGPITAPLDRAFLVKLRALVESVTASFASTEPAAALMETERFFWSHYTDTYMELAKTRARGEMPVERAGGLPGQTSSVETLRMGLNVILRLLAPFCPFTTEEVWGWAFAEEMGQPTIHRAPWPTVSEIDALMAEGLAAGASAKALPETFDAAVALLGAINLRKTTDKVSLARPIEKVSVKGPSVMIEALGTALWDVLGTTRAPELTWVPTADATGFEVSEIAYGPDQKAEKQGS